MSVAPDTDAVDARRSSVKQLTIGAVCKALSAEFPGISISKIRYLEDQRLLAPQRSAGGYRKYSADDVTRLRTILRLQRDEFLPLRVIRQELANGRTGAAEMPASDGAKAQARLRSSVAVNDAPVYFSLADVLQDTQADPELVSELEEFGVIQGEKRDGTRYYDETEREIIRAVRELSRYGVGGRNLRVFRSSVDREANLLQQILAPALRSRNPERRKEALEALDNLATVSTHLKHLLLVRDLRRLAG
ncbi:MAG: MerR family transcriptional regulator [Solirubrobacteraceae bacterium]|jgi:DNA-binding transcriptional MerR regulator